jgi:hypothetical protein
MMTEFVCKECGAANPPDARFCGGCDVYLGWDTKPPPPSDALEKSGSAGGADAPPLKDDNPAQAPKVDLPQSEADLPPDTGADLEMRIRNNSTIVDAYGIESAWAPKWLTITHPEIRLMPGESDSVTAHLAIAAPAVVEAQTLTPRLRIYSQRDTSKFVEVTVKLTVPRYGPPLTIRARPPVVRLVNNTSGRVEVTLDNAGSNYPRRAALAASDSEGVVQFRISPPTAVVPPGGHATANVDFNVPAVRDGENRVRQLTISAREEENTAEAAVTVNQERIAAAPLRLRLEPSVLRIRDGDTAEVTVVVDNRGQTPNREVRLQGYDPERTLRFSFAGGAVRVAAGQTTATKVRIVAPPPPPGKEVSRTFSIVASYGADEAQASGTFVQTTSDIPIKAALIRLTPETLKRRDSSYGRFLMSIENRDTQQWLQVLVSGSDPERAVRFKFSPPQFDIPPRGLAFGWVRVRAPRADRRKEESRDIAITATDGNESISARGAFVQSSGDWVPYVRFLLTLIGAVLVVVGAFHEPWTVAQPDYYLGDLPRITGADNPVQATQPAWRLAVIVLAASMLIGAFGKGGKQTMSAAAAIVAGMIGYFIYLNTTPYVPGGPMYGAVVVVVGAIVGFFGGLLAKL